jgi:NAD(P)-dependent dehydrogenase (short-subunit alcohol dehydrogenase family)
MSKVVIVTGASRGIGYEICRNLADKEHHAVGVARSEDSLHKLEQTNPQYIHTFSTDLTNQDEVNNLTAFVKKEFGKVDILINNAGSLINKSFQDLSLDDWRSQMESNVIGAVNISRKLLPIFTEGGHIVNISSMGGFQGSAKFPGLSAYSVSKGALSILTECLAVELADQHIKANALCLGAVQTEMLEEAFPGIEAPVNPEEMAAYITHFALNGSKFYNGKILPVALQDPE